MLSRSCLALLVLASSALAGKLEVPKDFATIQAAVDAAQDGDEVVVSKGLYPESVSIQSKDDLLLRGVGKPVIEATGQVNGLVVDNCVGIEVRGFIVRGAQVNDVLIQFSGTVTVTKCRLESSATGVKSASSSIMNIHHNDIRDQSANGIWFAANAALTGSEIVANRLRGMGDVGIRDDMPHILVDRNRIEGPLQTGIQLGTGADDVTLSRNRIRGAESGGVQIDSGTGHFADRNRIKDSGFGLFFLPGTVVTTHKNRITKPLSVGLRVDPDGCTLEGDRIASGAARGVELNGNGNVLTDVVVTKAGTDGFDVSGSNNELTGCKALHCGEDGFFVGGTANAFTKAKAKGSGEFDLEDPNGMGVNSYEDCSFVSFGP